MPRRRSMLPDGPFHVMAHGIGTRPLFRDDLDRRRYLGLLQQVVEREGWRLHTFALMGTHLHLLVWTTTKRLSRGMWWLHWQYAEWVKDRHHPWRGHVFDGRFKSPPIGDDSYLLNVIRYIAQNPVEAGMSATPPAFRWSADKAIRGVAPALPILALDDVLRPFGRDTAAARLSYASFVDGDPPPDYDRVLAAVEGIPQDRPPLDELLADGSAPALAVAHHRWGYSLTEIAGRLDLHRTTVARRIAAA